jgi:Tfp pilus assembly protein PilF
MDVHSSRTTASRWRRRAATALVLGHLALGSAAPAEWVEVRSTHFDVYSDAGAQRARRVAAEFEEIRNAIGQWFPALEQSAVRIPIFALSTENAMFEFASGYAGRTLAGIFRHHSLRADILLRLDVDTQHSFGVIYHEYFHAVTSHSLPGFPIWLNEGLAEIFGNSTISENKLHLGLANRGYLRLIGEAKLLPLERLIDPDTAGRSYRDEGTRPLFYAQSWALTHYFLFADEGAHWPELLRYLETMAQGDAEADAWRSVFGERDTVEKALWRYLNRGRFTFRTLEASVEVEGSSYPARPLGGAEVKALQGDFLSRGGNPVLARRLLTEALAEDDTLVLAHEAFGLVTLRSNELVSSRRHLERALELDGTRYLAGYSLALLELRQRSEGWAERATADLLRATRSQPSFAPAHFQLAHYYAQADATPDRAAVVARRAVTHAPEDALARLLLASLLRRQGKLEEAAYEIRFARHLASVSGQGSASNNVCWWGALRGLVEDVMSACEEAVRRDPEAGAFRDSRAVARALAGDLTGAVEDLRFFLKSEAADEPGVRTRREKWLAELEAGRNPIDAATLRELADEV